MTKVTIISGFLGAGKTTLIKKLLKEAFAGEKCVLLENEYGEVGIDGGFMKDSGIEITELNSGCICCTLAGDFTKAIGEIVERFHPDRLIIEPSGVGKLSDIRRVVEQEEKDHGQIHLTGCATVVDAAKCKMYLKNFGEFFIDQVKCAETVIFSRTQMISQEKLEAAVALVREQNADARLITTAWDSINGLVIIEAVENPSSLIDVNSVCPPHEHHHHHHHDDDDEHEHEHHHHHDDDDDEDDEDEHEHHHHHHDDDDDDEDEHEHHHHHHDDDDEDEDEHEHHHHDDDDEDEHEHRHHHHHHGHCGCGHDHDDHDADEVFDNIGFETVHKFDRAQLTEALNKLDDEEAFGTILRMKGILQTTDGSWIHFDYTPGEFEVRDGSADYTGRLCVIGVDLKEENIKALLGM